MFLESPDNCMICKYFYIWIPVSSTGMTGKRILDDRKKSTWMTKTGLLG
ncbi:hypothetical protein [Wolbachia endosymbiont of Drosophila nikananu]|nr:hypothetical protein [Wolbachia endosymbiont of Drosophila nikananu]